MQDCSQVEGQISGVGDEGFFGGSFAQAVGLELFEELFLEVGGEGFELAADGGFVDLEEAGDLLEGLLVEEVGGEEEAIFWREGAEGLADGVGEVGDFGGLGLGRWGGGG